MTTIDSIGLDIRRITARIGAEVRGLDIGGELDEGAVGALAPERVVLLPDGVEDAWSDGLADLVALA